MRLTGLSSESLSRISQAMNGSVSAFDFFGTDPEDIFSFAENFLGLEFTHWRDIEPFKQQKPSGLKSEYVPSIKSSDKDEIVRVMQDQADQEGVIVDHEEEYLEMVFEFLKEEGV